MKDHRELQPIFLIGAMKSGTTTISKNLSLHPEISTPPNKEPAFFCEKIGDPKYKVDDFYSIFELKEQHNYVLDASTHYTKYPVEKNVPQKIFEYGLKPKFIYIVRNPFDRIESHYNYMRRKLTWKAKITNIALVHNSNYYLQLEKYKPYFDTNEFLILDFEDLVGDVKGTVKEIYDFIGIPDYVFEEKKQQLNKTKTVNRNELQLKKKLGGKFNFLPEKTRGFLKHQVAKILSPKKIKLTKRQRKQIHALLKEDMLSFEKEYGVNVKKWGFNL
jgi:hypothetical protein